MNTKDNSNKRKRRRKRRGRIKEEGGRGGEITIVKRIFFKINV